MAATDGRGWRLLDYTDETTELIDLNTESGFQVGEGSTVGEPGLRRESLAQGGYDGEEPVLSDRTNAKVVLNLIILPQTDLAAVDALYADLLAAIELPQFTLEFTPKDAADPYLMDCFRSDNRPTLYRGQRKQPDCVLFDGYMSVSIERLPDMRGAASHT